MASAVPRVEIGKVESQVLMRFCPELVIGKKSPSEAEHWAALASHNGDTEGHSGSSGAAVPNDDR